MKVIDEYCPKIKLSELDYGEAFLLDNKLYMHICSDDADAVSLATGKIYLFTDAIDVERVDARVIVKK